MGSWNNKLLLQADNRKVEIKMIWKSLLLLTISIVLAGCVVADNSQIAHISKWQHDYPELQKLIASVVEDGVITRNEYIDVQDAVERTDRMRLVNQIKNAIPAENSE